MRRSQQFPAGNRGPARMRLIPAHVKSIALLFCLAIALAIPSAHVSAGINTWSSIGPEGGDIKNLVLDPKTPGTLYAATAYGGVFKSVDGAASWRAANAGLTTNSVNVLAIDPIAPSTLYLGTYGGLFKTNDGGASWNALTPGLAGVANALAIDPKTPSILYAGTASGVFKSGDAGSNWSPINTGMPSSYVSALAIDPKTPSVLYIGTWFNGVFKSTDSGANWAAMNTGLTWDTIYTLAIDSKTPTTVYAGTTAGVFRSTDAAASWAPGNIGLSSAIAALAVDPTTSSIVYAGANTGMFKSLNGGSSWRDINTGLTSPTVKALALDPKVQGSLYIGMDGAGVFKSANSGASWSAANSGLANLGVKALTFAPTSPPTLYAGTRGGVFKTSDRGTQWSTINIGLSSTTIYALAVDPKTPTTLYAGTAGSVAKSTDGGAQWSTINNGLYNPLVQALAIDPTTPATLYAGTYYGQVYKSVDAGGQWTAANTGLTATNIHALAIDPQAPNTIYAGTDMGVFKSSNGGASWNATNAGLTNADVEALAINPAAPSTLFAGGAGGLYKSINGGASWINILQGLVWAVAIAAPTTLYVGRSDGVYTSPDSGANWQQLNNGLTAPNVQALAIDPASPTILYAGTFNGGAFSIQHADEQSLSYAQVIDQHGEPVASAEVYWNGRLVTDSTGSPRLTDFSGDLMLDGLRRGDTLVAIAPIHDQPTVRSDHGGLAFRVNTTSLAIGADGGLHPFSVTTPTGPQVLTVLPQNTLVLFNLVVSIEWTAETEYMAQVARAMRSASDFLYDITDGQMAFGRVAIYDNAERWTDADIQIVASNIVRPHSAVGGIDDGDRSHVIRVGRAWDGTSGDQGAWDAPDGNRTLTHEFGHYALHLYDEYLAYVRDAKGNVIGERPAACTGPENRNRATDATNASVMDYQYASSELAMRDVPGLWSGLCQLTAQWQINGESDWETLVRKYADSEQPPRWHFTTPAERGRALAGPFGLPAGMLDLPLVETHSAGATEGLWRLTVYQPSGEVLRNAIVALYRRDGRVIGQGLTDNNGEIVLYGASQGDSVRASSLDGGLGGETLVTAAARLSIMLRHVGGMSTQAITDVPHLRVVATPSQAGQIELLLEVHGFDPATPPNLLVTEPGSQVGYVPPLSYSPTNGAFEGQISFAATERGTGRVQIAGRARGDIVTLQSAYRLQRTTNNQANNVYANDGNLDLRLEPASLPGGETYVVVMPPGAIPGPLPAGMVLIGDAYDVTASGSATLQKPALLTLRYDKALVGSAAAPAGLGLYRWDPNGAAWQPLAGTLDQAHHSITAQATALGTYALLAPPGPWSAPHRELFLPIVRR